MPHSVLVVEDDEFTRMVLEKRLRRQGYDVETAESGERALDLIAAKAPDLVISGLDLQGMTGRDLCRQVNERPEWRSIYFIMLTSDDSQQEVVATLDAGADEYLIKPINVRELIARVQAGLRIVSLQQDLSAANLRLNEALRQIDNELRVVAGIQRALLPQALPHSDTLRFGVFYQPSTQCGGDYYDIYPLSPSVFGLVIADVSGHGAPAMVAMALVRLLFHSYASAAASPADLLGVLNNQLYRHLPTEQYATMFFGALDSATGLLTYSSAGQPPPLFCRAATGEIASLPNCEGFPLKLVMPDVEYQNHTLQMAPGDKLLLYTDGVNEMMDPEGELYGFERLCDSVGACMALPPQERIERIAEDLRTFARGYPQSDDVTMLWADLS